jgi:hypothetical protein
LHQDQASAVPTGKTSRLFALTMCFTVPPYLLPVF